MNFEVEMATNWSILELMTSPFGSESMTYCPFKVFLEAKLTDKNFSVTYVNAILTLQFQPHHGQFDEDLDNIPCFVCTQLKNLKLILL